MNRIEKMLQELCPEGVEYKKLIDICSLSRGKVYSKTYLSENMGDYPVYSSQTANNGELGKISTYDYDGEFLTWTTDGAYAGTIFHRKGKFSITNVCGLISLKSKNVLLRFLYYWLGIEAPKHVYQGMGNPKLMSNQMEHIEIPVPPLPIQEEIVRILDHFTELTASLQAELQARQEQYEYYRNKLLTFDAGSVTWMKMSEIGDFYSGLSGKSKSDFENGNSKYATYMNVYKNLSLNIHTNDMVKIAKGEKQNTIQQGDVLFTGSSETPDECGMSSVVTEEISEPIYLNSFCFGFRPYDKSLFFPDFLKHLLRSKAMRAEITKTANGVTRFNVSKKLMGKILLPIPPYKEQKRLATILDKFETLVNDLSQGLPAEIAAVQEQYEYYRDKLLTFKRIA